MNIKGQITEISGFTLAKKELFNEIHEEYNTKYERLEMLKKKLEEIDAHDLESKEYEILLQNKRLELARIRKELSRENDYCETLKFMLNRSRDLAKKAGIPINLKNEELFRINLDSKKEKREAKQGYIEANQLEKKIKKIKKEMHSEKSEKEQSLDHKLRIYEDQQRLIKCIQIERQRHEAFEKNKQNVKKLQEFEVKIAELKQENFMNNELLKLNRYYESEERKFKAIQRVTHSSSIDDVLPYYYYLVNNKTNLEKTLQESLSYISQLNTEKKALSQELVSLKIGTEFVVEDSEVVAKRLFCEGKEKKLNEDEEEIEKLTDLIYSSINTLSRIVFQLGEEKSMEIDMDNITVGLGFCCIKIDKLMEVIQSYQNVYYIESVNTDIQYSNPPDFLKLNSSPQNLFIKNLY